MEEFHCPICNRVTPEKYREKHHLVPKCKKGKEVVIICKNCGDQIHKLFDISELNKLYSTLEDIKSHVSIQKWVKWVSNKPNDFSICMSTKKRK